MTREEIQAEIDRLQAIARKRERIEVYAESVKEIRERIAQLEEELNGL